MSAGRSTSFIFSPVLKFGSSLFKGSRAGGARGPCSRFIHRRVRSSPGDNVGKKVGRRQPYACFKSFRPPFSKGGAHPRRVALVAARRRRNPLYGAFFLQSFFFAPVVPKKKRRSYFADIISVCSRQAPPAAGASPRPTITVPKKKRRSPSGDIVSVKRVPTDRFLGR